MKAIVIAILALFLVACSAPVVEQQDAKADNTVTINGFKFSPKSITVKVGETIRWKNDDDASHTVKIDDVESPELLKGDAWTHVFDESGTYEYVCGLHPNMKGTVIVE